MAEETTSSAPPPTDPNEGPGKGKAFFDRARTVAATANFDYAIDMYVEGLNREPFNVDEHKALRDVGFNRKIKGGKSGGGILGLGQKLPHKGKTPKEGMLNAAYQLAKDVGNINHMLSYIRNADLLGYKDVILWLGPFLQEANRTTKSPKVEIFVELAEIYAKYEEFDKATDAAENAKLLKPNDMELAATAQRFAAQATIKRGRFDQDGDFKKSIKDRDATKKLMEEENLSKSMEYLEQAMEVARADYLKNPMEVQVINKYAKSLIEMDDEEHENEAIKILDKAFIETKIYRFKALIGDVRMKQFKRNIRIMNEALRMDPTDKDMLRQLDHLKKERLAYELGEFRERAEYMPTDTYVKFELAVRLIDSGLYDEAIVALQEAQNNPQKRIDALMLLGRCFLHQHMYPEAVETCKRSIDQYDLAASGNPKSRELHYGYARALEENGQIDEAIAVYSKITQWEISFRDARDRLKVLRTRQKKA